MFSKIIGVSYIKNKLSRINSSSDATNSNNTSSSSNINNTNNKKKRRRNSTSAEHIRVINRSQLTRANSIPSHLTLSSPHKSYSAIPKKSNSNSSSNSTSYSLPNSPNSVNKTFLISNIQEENEQDSQELDNDNESDNLYFKIDQSNYKFTNNTGPSLYSNNLLTPNDYVTIDINMDNNNSIYNFDNNSSTHTNITSNEPELDQLWSIIPNKLQNNDKKKVVKFV
ncbi:unnamed protein product [Candida verbasci]|uniref:Uncharacterized protein n=1 Tax=Candida verbasci TaxID=1227364 RepID=A0A9W4TYW4_9ASCO|nr:unnamed protein product [Candida verbasci]